MRPSSRTWRDARWKEHTELIHEMILLLKVLIGTVLKFDTSIQYVSC